MQRRCHLGTLLPGILLIVRWTQTIQVVGRTSVLPIPSIPGHPADPVGAYKHRWLRHRPPPPTNLDLLTFTSHSGMVTVTVRMLAQSLCVMLQELGLDSTLYSLHSVRSGGATAAYISLDRFMIILIIKIHR